MKPKHGVIPSQVGLGPFLSLVKQADFISTATPFESLLLHLIRLYNIITTPRPQNIRHIEFRWDLKHTSPTLCSGPAPPLFSSTRTKIIPTANSENPKENKRGYIRFQRTYTESNKETNTNFSVDSSLKLLCSL